VQMVSANKTFNPGDSCSVQPPTRPDASIRRAYHQPGKQKATGRHFRSRMHEGVAEGWVNGPWVHQILNRCALSFPYFRYHPCSCRNITDSIPPDSIR
jgi:hypothetical protein